MRTDLININTQSTQELRTDLIKFHSTPESQTESQTDSNYQTECSDRQTSNTWSQDFAQEPDKTHAVCSQKSLNTLNINSESVTSYSLSQTLKKEMKMYITQKRKRQTDSDIDPAQPDKLRPVKARRQVDSAD